MIIKEMNGENRDPLFEKVLGQIRAICKENDVAACVVLSRGNNEGCANLMLETSFSVAEHKKDGTAMMLNARIGDGVSAKDAILKMISTADMLGNLSDGCGAIAKVVDGINTKLKDSIVKIGVNTVIKSGLNEDIDKVLDKLFGKKDKEPEAETKSEQ